MNLVGKSREQIEEATKTFTHSEMVDELYSLATCEPMLKPKELAARRGMSQRSVMRLVKKGELRAHQTLRKEIRIPLSSVREYDRRTALFFSSNNQQKH